MMQNPPNRSTVVGVFRTRGEAERAVDNLAVAGFRDDQLGILTRSSTTDSARGTSPAAGTNVGEGAAAGAVTGGLLGAAASLLIPGVGPVIAGGIIATVLGSAVVGAAAGGVLGALVGLGVPEDEARYYEGEFTAGRTLVTVKTDDRWEDARSILRQAGAYDVHDQSSSSSPRPSVTDSGRVPVSEEDRIGRR
jgi:hypothetical protein